MLKSGSKQKQFYENLMKVPLLTHFHFFLKIGEIKETEKSFRLVTLKVMFSFKRAFGSDFSFGGRMLGWQKSEEEKADLERGKSLCLLRHTFLAVTVEKKNISPAYDGDSERSRNVWPWTFKIIRI